MFVYCLYNDGVNDSKVSANESTFSSFVWRMTPMPKMPKNVIEFWFKCKIVIEYDLRTNDRFDR